MVLPFMLAAAAQPMALIVFLAPMAIATRPAKGDKIQSNTRNVFGLVSCDRPVVPCHALGQVAMPQREREKRERKREKERERQCNTHTRTHTHTHTLTHTQTHTDTHTDNTHTHTLTHTDTHRHTQTHTDTQ